MIYLDYAASTPIHPSLHDKIADYMLHTGNAQSKQMHELHAIINQAKVHITNYFHGEPNRLFFTSGASESISTAIVGAAQFYKKSGKHLITFKTEHNATLATYAYLKTQGFDITILPVNSDGSINIEELEQSIRRDTILISVNHICNETGFIQDIAPIIQLKEKHGFMVHLDACQTVGKQELNLNQTPVDFITLSSHKCYGPQGIGALYIAENRHITPIIHGSHPTRSGTLPHGLIKLMGEAYKIAKDDYETNLNHVKFLKERFLQNLADIEKTIHTDGVPHILNVAFLSATPEDISEIRQHIYSQVSSACHEGSISHVLKARHIPLSIIKQSIRLSLGIITSAQDIDTACQIIINTLAR